MKMKNQIAEQEDVKVDRKNDRRKDRHSLRNILRSISSIDEAQEIDDKLEDDM